MTTRISCLATLWLCVSLAAQNAPKPGSEQEPIKAFVGNWTLTLQTTGSPDPAAPPRGKCTGKEHWEMLGAFFAVRQVQTDCDGTPGKSLEILRWDATKKTYILNDFDDDGIYTESKLTLKGRTWSMVERGKTNGKMFWHRCSFTFTSVDRIETLCEDSSDGKKWVTITTGQSIRDK